MSTTAAPERSVAGAVHEHCPPGWNGSPTDSDHRLASSVTICGSRPSHSRTGGSRAAVCSRYCGTGKTAMTGTLPAAGLRVNPPTGRWLREPAVLDQLAFIGHAQARRRTPGRAADYLARW